MKRPTLILAEDPQSERQFVEVLTAHFEIVAVVDDGDALVESVNRLHPEAVVSDVRLKGTNGIPAMIKIRARYPDLPIVLIADTDDAVLQIGGLAAGASAFLSRTEATHELLAVLRQLLESGDST